MLIHLKKAVEAARKIEQRYYKVNAMAEIASVMADLERKQDAYLLINECIKISKKIRDKLEKVQAMTAISYAMFKNRDKRYDEMLRNAIEIVDDLDTLEAEDAYYLIAAVMIETGRFENALKFINKIENDGARVSLYSSIAYELIEEGKKKEAMRIAEFFDDKLLMERIKRERGYEHKI